MSDLASSKAIDISYSEMRAWKRRIDWNDERLALLTELWVEGASASVIASRLGDDVSRNAVIGKVHGPPRTTRHAPQVQTEPAAVWRRHHPSPCAALEQPASPLPSRQCAAARRIAGSYAADCSLLRRAPRGGAGGEAVRSEGGHVPLARGRSQR